MPAKNSVLLENIDLAVFHGLSRVWSEWRTAVVIVKPETVLAWLDRPVIPPDVRLLIRSMAEANPLWDAPRIHGELLTLGIDVSQATVAR